MIYADRNGNRMEKTTGQDRFLEYIYGHTLTRMMPYIGILMLYPESHLLRIRQPMLPKLVWIRLIQLIFMYRLRRVKEKG